MKNHLIITFFLILMIPAWVFSQIDSTIVLLEAPEDWRAELLAFPLAFAPSLPYKGVEDIRFAKGWPDKNSEEFWAYALVWDIENDPKLTAIELEKKMKVYFDGLMEAVAEDKELEPGVTDNTLALFMPADAKNSTDFIGKVQVYDAFFLQDRITLNMKVRSTYCEKTNKYLVLFHVSPKEYEHEIWKSLEEVSINMDCKK